MLLSRSRFSHNVVVVIRRERGEEGRRGEREEEEEMTALNYLLPLRYVCTILQLVCTVNLPNMGPKYGSHLISKHLSN